MSETPFLCPAVALISPPATEQRVLIKAKVLKITMVGGARRSAVGVIKSTGYRTNPGLVVVNTRRGQRACWEEGDAFYGERV